MESDIGGTWLRNSYPGCACDNLSHLYNYSFAPNYDWTKKYVDQDEILRYLKSTARKYNIYDKVWFNRRITQMRWDEARSKWMLQWNDLLTGDQGTFNADIVFHGGGLFGVPREPKEFDAFTGPKWHSARWKHAVDLTGRTVGIVGCNAR
jgi:cation diffusion facilitator CzcD-associated flavoprotein CzcO